MKLGRVSVAALAAMLIWNAAALAAAQEVKPSEVWQLWQARAPGAKGKAEAGIPTLSVYLPPEELTRFVGQAMRTRTFALPATHGWQDACLTPASAGRRCHRLRSA